MEDDWPSHRQTALSCEVNSQPLTEAQRRRAELLSDPEIAIDDEEMWRRVDG